MITQVAFAVTREQGLQYIKIAKTEDAHLFFYVKQTIWVIFTELRVNLLRKLKINNINLIRKSLTDFKLMI